MTSACHQAWPLIELMLDVPAEENISESAIIGNIPESEDSTNDDDEGGATAKLSATFAAVKQSLETLETVYGTERDHVV